MWIEKILNQDTELNLIFNKELTNLTKIQKQQNHSYYFLKERLQMVKV